MEIGDWITLVAVLVAFAIGVASIWHTRDIQKREFERRQLSEIIDWALGITKCEVPIGTMAMASVIDAKIDRKILSAHLSELASVCAEMILKGRYMSNIASKSKFGQDLRLAILELMSNLETRIELLGRCEEVVSADTFDEYDEAREKVREHWFKQVRECIYKVIDLATNIKTTDASK